MPYLGVLEKIQRADCFVFLDTVQFEKNEWQNRNRIRTRDGGVQWITVPVNYRYPQEIQDCRGSAKYWGPSSSITGNPGFSPTIWATSKSF